MTLPWGYGKSKKTDGSRMGDEGRLYHENGKEHYFFRNMQEGSVTLLQ